jgi:hypothetical protein
MPATGHRQLLCLPVQALGGIQQMALPAVECNLGDFFWRDTGGHYRNKQQAEQTGKVRFGHRRRTAGHLNHWCPWTQPTVTQRIQKQRAGQAMLKAAGGMARLILEVQINPSKTWQAQGDQMGISTAPKIRFNQANRLKRPTRLSLMHHSSNKNPPRQTINHAQKNSINSRSSTAPRTPLTPVPAADSANLCISIRGLEHTIS